MAIRLLQRLESGATFGDHLGNACLPQIGEGEVFVDLGGPPCCGSLFKSPHASLRRLHGHAGIAQLGGTWPRQIGSTRNARSHRPCGQGWQPSPSVGSNRLPCHGPPRPHRWRIPEYPQEIWRQRERHSQLMCGSYPNSLRPARREVRDRTGSGRNWRRLWHFGEPRANFLPCLRCLISWSSRPACRTARAWRSRPTTRAVRSARCAS